MGIVKLKLPQMGESVMEATVTQWQKSVGDTVNIDDVIIEVATDKVDNEVPSEASGTLIEQLYKEGDVIEIGADYAVLETTNTSNSTLYQNNKGNQQTKKDSPEQIKKNNTEIIKNHPPIQNPEISEKKNLPSSSFLNANSKVLDDIALSKTQTIDFDLPLYSPLVRSIIKKENIDKEALQDILGTGKNGRITKNDVLSYLEKRPFIEQNTPKSIAPDTDLKTSPNSIEITSKKLDINELKPDAVNKPDFLSKSKETLENKSLNSDNKSSNQHPQLSKTLGNKNKMNSGDEILEMSRMRKIVAEHMLRSKRTSAHVQSVVEADITNLAKWRNDIKNRFFETTGVKITFTPIFIELIAAALREFPMLNSSVDEDNIILKKDINIGMATLLPNDQLVVPVIKNADSYNLLGLAKQVNELAHKARAFKLKSDDTLNGTYTMTNIGGFGTLFGTPIINQPQVGIMAFGTINKRPSVIESPQGDYLAIRQKIYLTHSYDHRIIDGALGGRFVKFIADQIENWDITREI